MSVQEETAEREALLKKLMETLQSQSSNFSNEDIRKMLSVTQNISTRETENEPIPSTAINPVKAEESIAVLRETTLPTTSGIEVYPRRPGSDDLGRDYEIKITALLALRCATMKDTRNMWIGSNVDQVGDFDDIVLFKETLEGKHFAYMLQLKHSEKPKKITQHDLTYSSKNKKANKSKEDFSLFKYSRGYVDLMKSIAESSENELKIIEYLRKADRIIFVLYTNKGVNEVKFLEKDHDSTLNFLNASDTKENIYKFNCKELDYDPQFLQRLVLFANQIHLNETDKFIKTEIKNILNSSGVANVDLKKVKNKFVKFIKAWTKGDAKKDIKVFYTLTKSDISNKLIDIVLDPYKLDFSKETYTFYEGPQKNIWNQIMCDKNITVINSDGNILKFLKEYIATAIRRYCSEPKKTWFDHLSRNTQNLFYERYSNFNKSIICNHEEITMFDIYRCLWFDGKIPLLLKINNFQDYQNILKILKLTNNNLRIAIMKKKSVELKSKAKDGLKQFFTLLDLNNEDTGKIENQSVKLQGRSSITLGELVDKSLYKYLKCEDIIQILLNEFSIGNDAEPLSDYFIVRSLSKVFLERDALRNLKGEIFLIENALNFVDEGCDNVFKVENDRIKQIKNLKAKKKPIHRLVYYNEEFFEWKESFGTTRNIRRFQRKTLYKIMYIRDGKVNYSPDVKDLWVALDDFMESGNSWNTTRVVSANPGTGKSMLMNLLAHRVPPDTWVLKINLNEHEEYYKNLQNLNYKASDHLKYFNEQDLLVRGCKNTELSRAVFDKLLKIKKILVLLDGFDEISIMYKEQVTQIAKCFHDEGYHMWITTRPVMKAHLEEIFNTFSITLKPFTTADQEQYLTNYFSAAVSPKDQEILNKFIKELLHTAKLNLHDVECKFTGVPLQTKLLADVFSEELKKSVSTGKISFNRRFDLLYLYEEFIKRKVDILCSKFGKDAERTRILFEEHQQLFSLQTVFENKYLIGLNIEDKLEEYCKDKKQEMQFLQREGVVVLNQRSSGAKYKFNVNFVHRTFGEYLAAKWLSENFNSEDEQVKKTVQVLINSRFQPLSFNVFLFRTFDRIVTKGCRFHLAILNGKLDELNENIEDLKNSLETKDKSGRSVLHIMAYHGIQHPGSYYKLMGTIKDDMADIIEQMPNNKITDIKDYILGYNALDYAIISNSLAVANKICEKSPNLTINLDIGMSLFKKSRYYTYCVVLGYRALLKIIVPYFAARDMLLYSKPRQEILESYCRLLDEEAGNQNFSDCISEFGVQTIGELFKFKFKNRDAESPFGNYYFDLRFAAIFGSVSNVRLLLAQGVEINKRDIDGDTPFHYATKKKRLEVLKIFLSEGAEVNQPGKDGNTALHYAAINGDNEIVEELLAQGADVNKLNDYHDTPIHFAVICNHFDTVSLLLLNGANTNIESKDGNTLLHYASRKGFDYIISEVLSRNPEVLNKQNIYGETALLTAIKGSHNNTVKLLLSKGARCDITNTSGSFPLHYAALKGNDEIVIEILSKDPNCINNQNKDDDTALHLACLGNHLSTIKLLLALGADCNMKGKRGNLPLHNAVEKGYEDIVVEFLSAGADINGVNSLNSTALHLANTYRQINIAKLLIVNNADINLKDVKGDTPLHCAASLGNNEIVSELLLRGADVNALTIYKSTPLHWALSYGHSETANILLSNGADWNAVKTNGITPLHFAAQTGTTDIVSRILTNGCDVNKQTEDGDTPLHLASNRGHVGVVQLLLGNSASVEIQNIFGKTPLHIAVKDIAFYNTEIYERQKQIVRLVLEKETNVNRKDCDGNAALHYACNHQLRKDTENRLSYFYNDVVLFLLEKGADVNLKNDEGKTALDLAKEVGYASAVAIIEQYSNNHLPSTSSS